MTIGKLILHKNYDTMFPDYVSAKQCQEKLYHEMTIANVALQDFLDQFPKNNFNVTPDYVKVMPDYVRLHTNFNSSFESVRQFNQWFTKKYKKDIKLDRKKYFADKAKEIREQLDSK